MVEQKLHYENMCGLLIRRDGFLHWRCPDCKAEGESEKVLRVCPECKQPDKKEETMTTTPHGQVPEALRLADLLRQQAAYHREVASDCDMRAEDTINWGHGEVCYRAADELHRLYTENAALRAQQTPPPKELSEGAYETGWKDGYKHGAWSATATAAQADSAQEAPNAMQLLTAALKADPEYAWAWHCNLAMPIMDNAKVSHRVANITAARLMQHLFGIDTEKHTHFEVADEAPQADSQPAPVRVSKDRLPNWSVESHMDAIPDPVASVTTSDARVVTPCRAARAPADSVLEDAARLWDAFVEAWRNELGVDKIVNIMGGADKLKAVFLDAARKQGANHD